MPLKSGNAYLDIAYEALRRANRPLSPSEMLELGREGGFIPDHLHGKTMHKTLAARLSENIRAKSQRSEFYRTAPAKFFAHSLADGDEVPEKYRKVYVGNIRAKSIRKEDVLVVPRKILDRELSSEFTAVRQLEFQKLFSEHCFFMDRQQAELDDSVKQFVTFSTLFRRNKILIHRRGKFNTASERLKGQLAVGFGGHVNADDFTLFDQGVDAFRSNACRELREELFLDDVYSSIGDTYERTNVLGYLNTDESPDAEHHIAVLIGFEHCSDEAPKKGELSINQLEWLDLEKPLNDLSSFDLWSGKILRWLYDGTLILRGIRHA